MNTETEQKLFEGNRLKILGGKKPKVPTTDNFPESEKDIPEQPDVTTIAKKLVKANIEGCVVNVDPEKTYSNGKNGAEIAAENPVRKKTAKGFGT